MNPYEFSEYNRLSTYYNEVDKPIDYKRTVGNTPLIDAVIDNDIEKVKHLLSLGANPNLFTYHPNQNIEFYAYACYNPLMFAIRNANIDIFKLLISNNADINFETSALIEEQFNKPYAKNINDVIDAYIIYNYHNNNKNGDKGLLNSDPSKVSILLQMIKIIS